MKADFQLYGRQKKPTASFQEVECAVIGSDPAVATRPGEILAGAEFYTYDDKYKNGVSLSLIHIFPFPGARHTHP